MRKMICYLFDSLKMTQVTFEKTTLDLILNFGHFYKRIQSQTRYTWNVIKKEKIWIQENILK